MKSCLALLLFLGCGLASSLKLEKEVVQPAGGEETLQDNIAHGMDQELPAEKREKEEQLQSQTTLEDVDEIVQPAREEETLQDNIAHGVDQELPAEKREKEEQLESQTTLEDVEEAVKADVEKRGNAFQLSWSSCNLLRKGGWCRDYYVAQHCDRFCCSDALSRVSCNRIKRHPRGCSNHFFKFGTCRKSCHGCWIHIYLHSEGCNDTNIKGCGHGRIFVNGRDYSLHRRGHNIVVIDRFGKLLKQASFDTYGDPSSGNKTRDFIYSIRWGSIVLIATQDSAEKYISDAKAALASLGAKEPFTLGFRSSWAFVGMKGNVNVPYKRQAAKPRYLGPTKIAVKINVAPIYYKPGQG